MTEREFAKLEKDAVTSLARLLATPGLATEQATEFAKASVQRSLVEVCAALQPLNVAWKN